MSDSQSACGLVGSYGICAINKSITGQSQWQVWFNEPVSSIPAGYT